MSKKKRKKKEWRVRKIADDLYSVEYLEDGSGFWRIGVYGFWGMGDIAISEPRYQTTEKEAMRYIAEFIQEGDAVIGVDEKEFEEVKNRFDKYEELRDEFG